MGYFITKASSDGYSGYRVINGYGMSVGQFFENLDDVADFLSKKVKEAHEELKVM